MPIGSPLSADALTPLTDWIESGASCDEELPQDTGGSEDTGTSDDVSVTNGEAISNSLCMGCHYSNGVDIVDESRGCSNAELRDVIQNGEGDMPAQGHLTSTPIDSVIAYIRYAEYENQKHCSANSKKNSS